MFPRKRSVAAILALSAACMLSSCNSSSTASGSGVTGLTDQRLAAAASEPRNWLTHGGTYEEQRFSELTQVTEASVGGLKLAWSFDLDTNRGQEATPLIVDGVMYTSTAWSKVVALDAASGKQLWSYEPEVPGDAAAKGCCDVVNRGVAAYDGKIFVGTLDGRLIALDAASGKVLWSAVTVDQSKPYTITGAPRVVKGKVLIGNGGAEFGVRGYVSAYDAATGRLAWRFYTVPGDPAKGPDGAASDEVLARLARPTWFGTKWHEYGGGGTVWDAIVYDPEFNAVYIGVGNGSPWNYAIRSEGKGDNLFLSSIVALDADTGKYKWHFQEVPGEAWDYTAAQQITLATLKIGGQDRKVIMHAPKNGFFYVVDRVTGKLISAENFVPVTWASGYDLATARPNVTPGARYEKGPFLVMPSALGAHNWHPMSYSPKTGLVYIPAQVIPLLYGADKAFKYDPSGFNLGIDSESAAAPTDRSTYPALRKALQGVLIAWDPVRQKEVWRVDQGGPWNGGTLATAGNLVFQGTHKGMFKAYRANDGKELWSFDAQSGVVAGPVSYQVGGKQFIAVMAGYGGSYPLLDANLDGPTQRPFGRVLAFALDGKATLPAAPADAVAPPNPPAETGSAAQIAQGRTQYVRSCARCHGDSARSSNVVPDLRRSGALPSAEAWQAIIIEGGLAGNGMVGFKHRLSPEQAEAIRMFVGQQAREQLRYERAKPSR